MPAPKKPDDHKFQVGDRVTVSLSAGGVVDGVVKAIINEVRTVEFCPSEVRPEEVRPEEVRPAEVRLGKLLF